MSLDHKAFEFDWNLFERELLPLLPLSLPHDDFTKLAAFIDDNLVFCRSPYDGSTLTPEWRELLDNGDAQEVADFALTKYYDPNADCGLGAQWIDVERCLPISLKNALLGSAITSFDPGRQGAYFQSPGQVRSSVELMVVASIPELHEFQIFLAGAAAKSLGVYVTF